ncbi:SUMF1/EgtB/PvdO family nonheme iron enzyme [Desulfamplus magnetovallimortis]|uniref:SUMF1/EgtB/PvdO family nonheme iron enzyme n=1 Tax=Desulfamplus magnetovallimortis TaxID=1246637 RepID=UPI00111B1EFF
MPDRKSGSNRVNRGGSWNNKPANVRCANRNRNTPDNTNNNLGFRLSSTEKQAESLIFTEAWTVYFSVQVWYPDGLPVLFI